MPEVEFAREAVKFTQMFLHMGVTHNWLYRMLVGRLYYAAHHLGRRLLMQIGMRPSDWRVNVHQRVMTELQVHFVDTGIMTSRTWTALEELRSWRQRADYELDTPVRLRHVNQAYGLFTAFAEECYRIMGVN